MYQMKDAFIFGLCVFIITAFSGCTAPHTGGYAPSAVSKETGAAYQPKLPPGIETIDTAKKDLAELLKPQNRFFYIRYEGGVNIPPNP